MAVRIRCGKESSIGATTTNFMTQYSYEYLFINTEIEKNISVSLPHPMMVDSAQVQSAS
jgi:hypothetical protein